MRNIGRCHYCTKPIPRELPDGELTREGIEYKQVWGEQKIKWHYQDPRYPDCWAKEKADPSSDWWDGNLLDRDDDPFILEYEEPEVHDKI